MADRSRIEWTEATWNPVRGCTKISAGCQNCYAEAFAERWRGIPGHPYEQGFELRLVPEMLDLPFRWKNPRKIFVNSMSDLFHAGVPDEYIIDVFEVMRLASRHQFQLLTKRAERLTELSPRLPWPQNVWVGVSIENQATANRLKYLLAIPAQIKFVSFEPLLGPVDIDLNGVDWVIVGGESGPHARPLDLEWVRDIRNHCTKAGVPLFLKQLGGRREKRGKQKAILDGQQWHEFPLAKQLLAVA